MIPDWTNRDPGWIHLIWAVAALTALWIVLELRGKDALARFLSPAMQARLVTRASTARTVVRLTLVAVALAACVWALMRPQTRGQDQAVMASAFSADVMVVLDVSKSMLATDVKPTRLERAKFEIAKMVKQLPGDRVGLVAFAGRAALLCPLTPDQGYFNLVLGGVDVNSVSRGGTRIGEALRVATKGFPTGPGAKLVVLEGVGHPALSQDPQQYLKAIADFMAPPPAAGAQQKASAPKPPDARAKTAELPSKGVVL